MTRGFNLIGVSCAFGITGVLLAAQSASQLPEATHPPTLHSQSITVPHWEGTPPASLGVRQWGDWAWHVAVRLSRQSSPFQPAPWWPALRQALIALTQHTLHTWPKKWDGTHYRWTPVAESLTLYAPTAPTRDPWVMTVLWGVLHTPDGALINRPIPMPPHLNTGGRPFRAVFAIVLMATFHATDKTAYGPVTTYQPLSGLEPVASPPLTTWAQATQAIHASLQAWNHAVAGHDITATLLANPSAIRSRSPH